MIEQTKNLYAGLPIWAKVAVGAGGVIILYAVGKKIATSIFGSADKKRYQVYSGQVDGDIKNLSNKGLKPSYKDSQYTSFANTIYNGMRYCVGDDYGTVEETMKKMNNDLDVAKLIKAFGLRQDSCFGINGAQMDLFTYIQKELGNDYGGLTNYRVQRINADWKKKGITYII